MNRKTRKAWAEAVRPRTLPVSVAGVFAGTAVAILCGSFRWLPALICMLFALGAQIVSNFANEYYDAIGGLDRKGRVGFRRGVTEGDISPRAMKRATYSLLAVTCLIGCTLICRGGWWLLPVGIAIALFALAYSTGPWPLSHHGLGDLAVIIFFGVVPVTLTAWLQCGSWTLPTLADPARQMWQVALPISLAAGMLAANVLIVNNYRDVMADAEVGKKTTVVIFGRKTMGVVYLLFNLGGPVLMAVATWRLVPFVVTVVWAVFLCLGIARFRTLINTDGAKLNAVLGSTARLMLLEITWLLITSPLAA